MPGSSESAGHLLRLFFVTIGLLANARILTVELLPFVLLVCLAAIVAKVAGSGLGAFLGGFTRRQSLQVGTGMVSRAEVVLIVAGIGVDNGIIGSELLTIAVVVVLATTLVTPLLLRWAFRGEAEGEPAPLRRANAA